MREREIGGDRDLIHTHCSKKKRTFASSAPDNDLNLASFARILFLSSNDFAVASRFTPCYSVCVVCVCTCVYIYI